MNIYRQSIVNTSCRLAFVLNNGNSLTFVAQTRWILNRPILFRPRSLGFLTITRANPQHHARGASPRRRPRSPPHALMCSHCIESRRSTEALASASASEQLTIACTRCFGVCTWASVSKQLLPMCTWLTCSGTASPHPVPFTLGSFTPSAQRRSSTTNAQAR